MEKAGLQCPSQSGLGVSSGLPSPCGPSPLPWCTPWCLSLRMLGLPHPSLCSLGSEQSFWIHFSRQEEAGKTLR